MIAVPIRASLAPIAAEIESRIESKFSGREKERGIDVRYEVARDPLQLKMIGAGLHTSTTVKYALEACRGRFPCISCGFNEARRVADITLQTKLDWDPSWRLRSTTRLLPVHYAKPCEVTWLDIDITRRFVAPVVEEQLTAAARILDRQTPAQTNLRPRTEQIWSSLQQPVELAPRTWLVLEPTDVALSPISGSGANVTSTLTLHATTRVVVGEKPATARKPLPALRVANAVPDGMRVPFDLELPYDEASRIATRDYANRPMKIGGKPLTIETIRLLPAGSGRVQVEAKIDYRGGGLRNYRGLIYLQGTPTFRVNQIELNDLDYTLDRRGFLANLAERAAHESIRQKIREAARFDLRPRLDEARAEVTRALNRKLADGVVMRGRAETIEPVSVTAGEHAIRVRVIATGSVEVDLVSLAVR
ncbi:MAG TPA: DUF4403 family protein [Thermoanaerobaculia bacterium]|nr:DUF4403 family protein [Thermoanaerobaculia bacterium]